MDIHIFWEQACGKALGKRIKSLIAKGIHRQGSGWAIGGQQREAGKGESDGQAPLTEPARKGGTHPAPRTDKLVPDGKGGPRLPLRVRPAGLRRHCPAWA